MGKTVNKFNKSDVYIFAAEVDKLLNLLNGVIIQGNDSQLKDIEYHKNKLENKIYNFKPTLYEEYSYETKIAYNLMIKAREEYYRLNNGNYESEVIERALRDYKEKEEEYKRKKEYRDMLKQV